MPFRLETDVLLDPSNLAQWILILFAALKFFLEV